MQLFICNRISLLYLFVFMALFTSLRYSRLKTFLILAFSYVAESAVDFVPLFVNEPVPIIIKQIVIVQLTVFVISKYRDFRALYVGTSAAAFVLTGDFACNLVFEDTKSLSLAILVQITVHTVLLLIHFVSTHKKFLRELECKDNNWLFLTCVPVLSYITVLSLGDPRTAPVITRPEDRITVFFILLLMIVTNVVVIRFLSQKTISQEAEMNNMFLKVYSDGLERNAVVLHQTGIQLSYMRHDIKHFVQMILGFINSGDIDKAHEALVQINENIDEIKPENFCENIAVNGIIMAYSQKMQKSGIKFESVADVPLKMETINEFELATVVANLLDNALNAAIHVPQGKEKYVKIKMLPVKEMLMIEVCNTFEGKIKLSKATGLPETNRGAGHGYGMRSVKAFVERWKGSFHLSFKDNVFFIKIIVKM